MAQDATTDTVTLTMHEINMAANVGLMRQLCALKAGKHDAHGFDGAGWSEHIEGACGELAVAKILGRYWDGSVNTWKADDLPGLQIRTRSRHDYDLIVRPGDDDQAVFVLVTGQCPEYRVRGWITGAEAKRRELVRYYGCRPAAYFVPAEQLRGIEEIGATAASR